MSTVPATKGSTEIDKARLLEALRKGGDAFLCSVGGVGEAACRLRPAENRWSVLECAEHVAVAEEVMLALVTGEKQARDPEGPRRDDRILRSGTDRSTRFDASDQSQPRGRFSTLAEAVAHFQAVRQRTLRFVEQTGDDLRAGPRALSIAVRRTASASGEPPAGWYQAVPQYPRLPAPQQQGARSWLLPPARTSPCKSQPVSQVRRAQLPTTRSRTDSHCHGPQRPSTRSERNAAHTPSPLPNQITSM